MRYSFLLFLAAGLLAQNIDVPLPRIFAGSLTGTVTTPDGKAVRCATILLRLQPRTGVNLPDFTLHAVASNQGDFALRTLPVGKYTVCPQSPDDDVLNPCDWSRQPPEVEIFNGAAATLNLVMQVGHRVSFQINDAAGIVDANAQRAQPPTVSVGVTTPYGFLPARTGAKGPTRKDYSVVVPYATPVDAYVPGSGIEFEDDKGRKATNQSLRFPLRLKPGDPPKSAIANVTALKGTL